MKWSGKCKYNSTMKSNVQVSSFTMVSNGKGNETALTAALASIGINIYLYLFKNINDKYYKVLNINIFFI